MAWSERESVRVRKTRGKSRSKARDDQKFPLLPTQTHALSHRDVSVSGPVSLTQPFSWEDGQPRLFPGHSTQSGLKAKPSPAINQLSPLRGVSKGSCSPLTSLCGSFAAAGRLALQTLTCWRDQQSAMNCTLAAFIL